MADNLNDCAPAVRTVSNGGCPAIRIVGGGGGKNGVISQTQTWTQAADGGYDYAMSDQVEGTIPQASIDLFASFGAIFNEDTGYFELNGLTDISYNEMLDIYGKIMDGPYPSVPSRGWQAGNFASQFAIRGRTTLPAITQGAFMVMPPLTWNYNIEVAHFTNNVVASSLNISGTTFSIYACAHLKSIDDVININTGTAADCRFCPSLETIYFKGVKYSISFAESSRLTVASVLYMIQNEASTSAITITLHPTAYARAIADADVQTALAAHPNVTLASA